MDSRGEYRNEGMNKWIEEKSIITKICVSIFPQEWNTWSNILNPHYYLFPKRRPLTKQVLIVERRTKSLRSLKQGAVYDEGKKLQMRDWCWRLLLIIFPWWTEHPLNPRYSTWYEVNMAYTPQNKQWISKQHAGNSRKKFRLWYLVKSVSLKNPYLSPQFRYFKF